MIERSIPFPRRSNNWQTLNAYHLVHDAVRASAKQFAAMGIDVQVDVPRSATLVADLDSMRGALRDLIQCAVAAMPEGGELSITVWSDERGFELEVADSRAQAIIRNRSPLACRQLPESVRHASQLHGGELTVANCPQGGLAVTLRIPSQVMRAAA